MTVSPRPAHLLENTESRIVRSDPGPLTYVIFEAPYRVGSWPVQTRGRPRLIKCVLQQTARFLLCVRT